MPEKATHHKARTAARKQSGLVLCRDCYTKMVEIEQGWLCLKCGREWKYGPGYTIGTSSSASWIFCHHCGMRSYNPNDIEQRYCGNCHKFHEELSA